MPYKQDTKKIDAWKKQNIDRIVVEARKDEHIPDRIQLAIEAGKTKSRQAYILDAIRSALNRDGIPPASNDE